MLNFFRRLRGTEPSVTKASFTASLNVTSACTLVGDVHGRIDLLKKLLSDLSADSDVPIPLEIVFVGDYVDRGDGSADVLYLLSELDQSDSVTCLMGNHEKMMIDFMDYPAEKGRRWLRNGGLQTLASFGVGGVTEVSDADKCARAAGELSAAMGPKLESWIRDLPLTYENGNMVCVHAAADPHLPIVMQKTSTLLWGHPEFFDVPRADGIWISHGHTIVETPSAKDGRISLDTGAYYTGRLTAAILEPNKPVRFIESS